MNQSSLLKKGMDFTIINIYKVLFALLTVWEIAKTTKKRGNVIPITKEYLQGM